MIATNHIRAAGAPLAVVELPAATGRREAWIDLAKSIAIVAVVAEHAAIPLVQPFDAASARWWTGIAIWAGTRFAVPVFMIASGALALDPGRREPAARFYRGRAVRIGPALVAWSLVYLFVGALVDGVPTDPGRAVALVLGGRPYYHLYFLYAIAGLYLVTPVLRRALAGAATRRIALLAALAFTVGAADAVSRATLGVTSSAAALTMWVPYLGYYLVGPLVRRARPSSERAPVLVAVAAGSIACAIGATAALSGTGRVTAGYALDYLAPFTIAGSLSIALLMRIRHRYAAPWAGRNRWLATAATTSFGVYLVHPLVLDALGRVIDVRVAPAPGVALATTAALMASAVVVAMLRRVPFVRAAI